MNTKDLQRVRDEEHLKLLGIFFYVSGGLSAFFGLFPLIYVLMGAVFMAIPEGANANAEAAFAARSMGAMFAGMGLLIFVFAQSFAVIKILAGYWLLRKRNRVACLIIAGIICIGIPYSTILGVFTFVVLLRDSVRDLFAERDTPATETPAVGSEPA